MKVREMSGTLEDHNARVAQSRRLIFRHSLVTRVTHWTNLLCVTILLMSGLQIFNAHPALYWGHAGADPAQAWLEIGAWKTDSDAAGVTRIGNRRFDTTGVLGLSRSINGSESERAFPRWATLPSWRDLSLGRRWHFFFAWLFVANLLVYLIAAIASGHLRRDLLPSPGELRPRALWSDIKDHLRLKFPRGEAARRYNPLQKLSYLAVALVLLPVMVLTGLSMSPGMDAIAPWLIDIFGGRQSARTIHFLAASLIVLFVLIHVAMVIVAGPKNELRSMITGKFDISPGGDHG
jgi:thiosulfate reductase cytochrome b subunit